VAEPKTLLGEETVPVALITDDSNVSGPLVDWTDQTT
jgi:hypothetical protein